MRFQPPQPPLIRGGVGTLRISTVSSMVKKTFRHGLFIGRFQPLHKGHLLAIREIALQCERLTLGIGSVNAREGKRNPFSAEERREMIWRAMKEIAAKNYEIIEIEDESDDKEWLQSVQKKAGNFDMCWAGQGVLMDLFKKAGLPITKIKEFPGLSGTRIRRAMERGLPWRRYIPMSVRKYLDEIGAVRRVRELEKQRRRDIPRLKSA